MCYVQAILVPVELADNQTYVLDMLGQPEDYNAAKEYVKQPTLAVLQGKTSHCKAKPHPAVVQAF